MTEENDTVGNQVVPMPVLIYGRSWCEDTAEVRQYLDKLGISFMEINIEEDQDAASFVKGINKGRIVTPTLVFGNQELILVEPGRRELDMALRQAGYEVNGDALDTI